MKKVIDTNFIKGINLEFHNRLETVQIFKSNKNPIYAHFFLIKNWIKKDISLVSAVFEKILTEKKGTFLVKKRTSLNRDVTVHNINNWRVDIDTIIGGNSKSSKACYEVNINLMDTSEIKDYVKNGKKRTLLETLLYPNFLSENSEVITIINVQEDKQKFIVGDDSNFGRVGINTVL